MFCMPVRQLINAPPGYLVSWDIVTQEPTDLGAIDGILADGIVDPPRIGEWLSLSGTDKIRH